MPENKQKQHAKKGEDRVVTSWETIEYIQHQRSARWYIVAGVVVSLSVMWGIITRNWSMTLAIVVFTVVYQYIHVHHPPKNIKIIISEMGIRVGANFYPYSHINAFWMMYKHGLKTLNLRVASNFFSDITIQLNEEDPVEIRRFLVGEIPEWEGKEERLGDILLRVFKL